MGLRCFMGDPAHVLQACAGWRGGKDHIFIINDPRVRFRSPIDVPKRSYGNI